MDIQYSQAHEHPSRAALFGHPIHPMLVPFPIAFLIGALVTDIVFAASRNPFWAVASFWLTLGGVVMALVSALFGLWDFLAIDAVRQNRVAWVHLLGNVLVVLIALASLFMRWGNPARGALPSGLILSIVITAILCVTGWLGGELSYRYKIGVSSR